VPVFDAVKNDNKVTLQEVSKNILKKSGSTRLLTISL
jgi:hypothetical protein